MISTYEARVDPDGRVRLTEPATLPPGMRVHVLIVDDEETLGGYPVPMLLAASSLNRDWDTPEEDEAWKEFQDEVK